MALCPELTLFSCSRAGTAWPAVWTSASSVNTQGMEGLGAGLLASHLPSPPCELSGKGGKSVPFPEGSDLVSCLLGEAGQRCLLGMAPEL